MEAGGGKWELLLRHTVEVVIRTVIHIAAIMAEYDPAEQRHQHVLIIILTEL